MKRILVTMQYIAERFAAIITFFACAALVIATLHITADVFMTRIFKSPLIGTYDIVTTYYMVALFFLPLAYAESRNAHIKADLFFSPLPRQIRRLVTILTYLLLSGFLIVLSWQSLLRANRQTNIGDMRLVGDMYISLWPPRWIALLGVTAFALVAIIKTISLIASSDSEVAERSLEDVE